ncbi:hypothetical protein EF405_02815 [Cyclobacteriaceae bacterium YHN15]|nr:hypothetical protein EF405_02815 [Cyclobacteriaceae bacterium YHN15]
MFRQALPKDGGAFFIVLIFYFLKRFFMLFFILNNKSLGTGWIYLICQPQNRNGYYLQFEVILYSYSIFLNLILFYKN